VAVAYGAARLALLVTLGFDLQRLNPKARETLQTARGYVDPRQWDAGVNAATLEYRYNGWRRALSADTQSRSQTSHYLSLRAGLNLGDWRLRAVVTTTRGNETGWRTRSDVLIAERALPDWKSRLTLGQTFSEGQVFERINLTGITLDSDERMRPDSLRGFAPVVRGVAQSTAGAVALLRYRTERSYAVLIEGACARPRGPSPCVGARATISAAP